MPIKKIVDQYIDLRYAQLTRKAVGKVKKHPCAYLCMDSAAIQNVWQEYKSQVQYGESYNFELLVSAIEETCRLIVLDLPTEEQQLLWLGTDDYYEHDDSIISDRIAEAVAMRIYHHLYDQAEKEPLPKAEKEMQDYMAARRSQEDMELYRMSFDLPEQ